MNPMENNFREAFYDTPLLSGTTPYVPLSAGYATVMDARHYRYLIFGFQTQLAATVTLEGALTQNMVGVARQLFTIVVGAATYTTVYDLPAPMNATGVFVLTMPFIRLQLTETAVADHTYTNCYVKLW